VGYVVEFEIQAPAEGIDLAELHSLAGRTLSVEAVPHATELSVVLADDATVRTLNRDYRATDAATDVLSFAQLEGDAFARPDGAADHLGDVIISVETARRQADEYGQTLDDEVSHLLVHGILHLLGYDHELPQDAVLMRAHEDAVLGAAHHH
jgi:probable rRNA maturation factor